MTIPFLDALLPSTAAKPATNNAAQGNSRAFEALLTGLNVSGASLPGEVPVAAPGTALPPAGKTLPEADDPVSDREITDGLVTHDRLATISSGLLADESADEPAHPVPQSAVFPAPPATPAAIVTAIVAPLAWPILAGPGVIPNSPPLAASAIAPAPALRSALEPSPTVQPTPDTSRKNASGEPFFAPQNGLAAQPHSSVAHPPEAPFDARKPAQPLALSLATLPTGAQPTLPGAAPLLRRGPESKPVSISLTAALSVAPETASATIFAAPVAVLAAPVAVAPGSGAPEVATSPVQPAASPIALPDHRALVEALVRARTERDPGISVALDTREFGAVALRFETLQSATGERGLQVAFSSGDPAFERAVASAAAAQSALADQSGRNPANRADSAPMRSGEYLGDGPGARSSSSDPQAQQRGAPDGGWRDTRLRQSADPDARGGDHPAAAPRADRRRGSIFA